VATSGIFEYRGNLHMHTPYSDGYGSHQEIAEAAVLAGLDFVIVTDHNIWVDGVQGFYGDYERGHVLLLTGEEVHDRTRLPQVNHCLVFGAHQEVSQWGHNPQLLIDEVRQLGGLTFLAHPYDEVIRWHLMEPIPWVDWQVRGYTGLEIWNYMSDFKDILDSPWQALRSVFKPEEAVIQPDPRTLKKWDALLTAGYRVVGIGGSDAHAKPFKFGPVEHIVFPYDFLFQCVNTHILSPHSFLGERHHDEEIVYEALRQGRAFISYEIVGPARGFRFSAQGGGGMSAQMGESIPLGQGVTLQALAPARSHIKLIHQGRVVQDEPFADAIVYVVREPGYYRVEVWREYAGVERCWIISNPIYIEANRSLPEEK
jgi:hypothetical protein